ncbi:DNA replication licensing factor MCM5 [Giardia muris]|uniref:DNA helicase n=1 Tax=Giardia muris TaxID=5742 RepID=A0A4Z1T1P1_GIAMU|nr:DNA replication licensing factor MCM5 [Giardia muris]|eukprot:TNJ26469.1 DNA replication licensing factor MCM5 [Giardia muris]
MTDPLAPRQAPVSKEVGVLLEGSDEALRVRIAAFLDGFHDRYNTFVYRRALQSLAETRGTLAICCEDLKAFDHILFRHLVQAPTRVLGLIRNVISVKATEYASLLVTAGQDEPFTPIVELYSTSIPSASRPSNLEAKDLNHLVTVRAIVTGTSRLRSKTSLAVAKCRVCGHVFRQLVPPGMEGINLPMTCQAERAQGEKAQCGSKPYTLNPHDCTFIDQQTIKLQNVPGDFDIETDEDLRVAGMDDSSRVLSVILEGCLVQPDLLAGTKVLATGILSTRITNRTSYLLATGIHLYERPDADGALNIADPNALYSEYDIDAFKKFAASGDTLVRITKSIAPQIYGVENAKLAIACLLFGGTTKYTSEGMRLRGNINVLLVSDPGLGKSEMLLDAAACAPVGIYTSGKSTSAVGLTAGVLRDRGTGEFYLEGGALVLADRGVVCIDEIDKMDEKDRVALHEAMEQGTVSISKAGISATLNTRTSILAAANPVLGRFDDFQRASDQLNFSTTILSRFDLIFLLRDRPSEELDGLIVDQIADIGMHGLHLPRDAVPRDFLRKYIAYAQATCFPRITQDAIAFLQAQYIQLRRDAAKTSSQIPITVRQLEALVRISEALAKMRLQNQVAIEDVRRAFALFQQSTADAQAAGLTDLSAASPAAQQMVLEAQNAVRNILHRGATISENGILRELVRLGVSEGAAVQAISILLQAGVLERVQRGMLRRQ